MSKENLDQFIQKVTDSEELQARIGEEMDIDSLIALGAEHGCEFTADDLTAANELSDEELDAVAGGYQAMEDPAHYAVRYAERAEHSGAYGVRQMLGNLFRKPENYK